MTKRVTCIIILLIQCSSALTSIYQNPTSNNAFFKSQNINKTFKKTDFTDFNLDGSHWKDVIFDRCKFGSTEFVRYLDMNNVSYNKCKINGLSFYLSSISNVYFENSNIPLLEFNDCVINKLVVRNCIISQLKLNNSRINDLIISGGTFDNVDFIKCNSTKVDISHIKNCGKLTFKSGEVVNIKLLNTELSDISKIAFIETKVNLPRFGLSVINGVDLTRANIDFKSFKLLIDYESDQKLYSDTQIKNNYLEARDSYYVLKKQFQNAGISESQISLEILMHEAYRKSMDNGIKKCIYTIWDKWLRGYYGLRPSIVIFCAFIIWFIFAFIYFSLGYISNIGWALLLPMDIHGRCNDSINPKFLNKKNDNYLGFCLLFSIQQLLIPGFSKTGITMERGIGFSQKLLIPVGIGKLFSLLEYIVGLILIFNFIQAFIRTF